MNSGTVVKKNSDPGKVFKSEVSMELEKPERPASNSAKSRAPAPPAHQPESAPTPVTQPRPPVTKAPSLPPNLKKSINQNAANNSFDSSNPGTNQ
jgi:hypothetical protein